MGACGNMDVPMLLMHVFYKGICSEKKTNSAMLFSDIVHSAVWKWKILSTDNDATFANGYFPFF